MCLAARNDAGLPPFFDGTHWTFPAPQQLIKDVQAGLTDLNSYPVDERGLAYHYAYIGIKRLGAGQFYMISIKDKDGESYDGGKTYRLTVPPNAPVEHMVGHGIRSGDARAHQERRSRQPRVEQHRSEEKRRRISRFVFRSEGTRGQRVELGTYGSGAQVRADGALLRADQSALREGVETP